MRLNAIKSLGMSLVLLFAASSLQAAGIDGKKYKDWVGKCDTNPQGQQFCYIFQMLRNKDTDQPVMMTMVGYENQSKSPIVIFHLPKEINQQELVQLKVDNNEPIAFKVACNEQQCRAGFQLDSRMMKEFKKGTRGLVAVKQPGKEEPVFLPVSLSGFTKGFNAIPK